MKLCLENARPLIEKICSTMRQVGLSYSVFYHGKQILAAGHGLRNEAKRLPVDEHALYNIASCTKAFIAYAVTLLAKECLVDMNVPVKQYVPELKDDRITLVDLLAHRTGYARLDMTWVGINGEVLVTHDKLISRINALPRVHPLRSKFLYNKWMYALVAMVIEGVCQKVKGEPFLEFMRKRIFKPFGLNQTCIERTYLPDDGNSLSLAG